MVQGCRLGLGRRGSQRLGTRVPCVSATTFRSRERQPLRKTAVSCPPGDPYGQTKAIFAIVGSALEAVGASFTDVVRTRIFLKDITHWQEVGRAHGEIFSEIRPASTMVEVSRLIDPAHLVEIEVDAIIAEAKPIV